MVRAEAFAPGLIDMAVWEVRMKIKVSNYISQFLVEQGITNVFTVTGGGAMHLNDALGHQKGLTCLYQHHEQACAIAAESYARIHNQIAVLCVTTGPGGTNALTGVVGAYLDSIPMLVLSGQVRYDTTARSTGLGIPERKTGAVLAGYPAECTGCQCGDGGAEGIRSRRISEYASAEGNRGDGGRHHRKDPGGKTAGVLCR